jgi:hypothetical protein
MAQLKWNIETMLLLLWLFNTESFIIVKTIRKSDLDEPTISNISYFQFLAGIDSYYSSGTSYRSNFGVSLLKDNNWIGCTVKLATGGVFFVEWLSFLKV